LCEYPSSAIFTRVAPRKNTFSALDEIIHEKDVGAKAFHLSRLTRAGLTVPKGFVVDRRFHAERGKSIDRSLESFLENTLPQLKSSKLMVRSSAIGEDSVDHSFAGQLDSFISSPNLKEVSQYIQRCWDSLEGERAIEYGARRGKTLDSMGVILQEMIEPDFAGVLFTHSPANYDESLLEYVNGHAEKLVSGEVTPESVSFARGSNPNGIPFPVEKLLQAAGKILQIYRSPQDIEWAVRDGEVFIVQTRPITTFRHTLQWSNTNVNENYPNKLSPFLYSLARTSYYHYFRNLALNFGVYQEEDDGCEESLSNIIGLWGYRMYYNMSSIHRVMGLSPFGGMFQKSFDDFVGYQGKSGITAGWSSRWKKIKFAGNVFRALLGLKRNVRWIEERVDSLYERIQLAHPKDIRALNRVYHQFLHLRFTGWRRASPSDFFAMLFHGLLGKLCAILSPEKASGIQNELIQSIPNLVSNRPIFEIYRIYQMIEKSPDVVARFEGDPEKIWADLKSEPESELTKSIQQYLDLWGYRCSGELTLEENNYLDDPAAFISLLKVYRGSNPEDPAILFERKHQEQRQLLKNQIRAAFSAPGVHRFYLPFLLGPVVKLACLGVSSRERVRLKQAKLYYGAKMILNRFGEILVSEKVIDSARDILFLEYGEVSRIFSGDHLNRDEVRDLIQLRKRTQESAAGQADQFSTHLGAFDEAPIVPAPPNFDEGVFKGLPVCGGVVEGRVRVLESMHEISRLQKGDILVTRQTDPGWICAFPMISGLIVERGGMLSHGAIVAREFGIPAIVGVNEVTKRIPDGARVRLDAYHGTIVCLS
jgi:rifampicin phosphotransferase